MWIVRLALPRPYTFVVMAVLIVILGGMSIATLPVDIFPYIDIPSISRTTSSARRSARPTSSAALPNRSTRVTAPEEIQPKHTMTRAQLMARFREQRARTLAFAQETEAKLRHNLQIAEVKTASDYPR